MDILIGFIVLLVIVYVFMQFGKKNTPSTNRGNASNTVVVDRSNELDEDNRRPLDVGDDKSPVDWDNDSRHQL